MNLIFAGARRFWLCRLQQRQILPSAVERREKSRFGRSQEQHRHGPAIDALLVRCAVAVDGEGIADGRPEKATFVRAHR